MAESIRVLRLLLSLISVLMLVPAAVRWYGMWGEDGPEQRSGASVSPTLVRTVTAVLIGAVPVAVWVIAPGVQAVAAVELPLIVRRLGLLAGGSAVAVLYLTARAQAMEADDRWSGPARFAPLVYAVGAFLISANWLVGAATAVSGVMIAIRPPAGLSSSAGHER